MAQRDPNPTPLQLQNFRGTPAFLESGADCLAVHAQSTLEETLNPILRDLTRNRYALIDAPAVEGTQSDVVVAVIDTTPPTDPSTPRSDHGLLIADFIADVANGCEAGCNIEVKK